MWKIVILIISINKNNKILNNDGINESNHYCIETDNEEIAVNYVQTINFTLQLDKYRAYVNKKKEKK